MKIASVPRREGETAFPEVATLLEAIRAVVRERRRVEREQAEKRWHEDYRAKAMVELEEDKLDAAAWQAQLQAAAEKLGMDRKPKVINTTPVMECCPNCGAELPIAPNIRFWSVQEMRAFADVMEANQEIAKVNREAAQKAAEEAVEAVHEGQA